MRTNIGLITCFCIASAWFINESSCAHKDHLKNDPINKVHLVFMNHLDVGYSDGTAKGVGFAIDVINRYFSEFFPRAVRLASDLTQLGYEENFIYTSHPWLVSMYVNCPDIALIGINLKCPSARDLDQFTSAVRNGTIAWHAAPMNMQTDNMGADMVHVGLFLSKQLDKTFGIARTHATYSQRDVPGMTKAIIPILMGQGVKAISVGVNPGSAPPAVPSPFVWKMNDNDPDGILAFWGKGGYPVNPGSSPSHPGGLSRDNCVMAAGLSEALCFAFRTDNTGPPANIEEILSNYEIIRSEFPNAQIVASTFDNFVASLETVKASLPVRSYEIGDTWIQGIAADPLKTSLYRAFVRCLEICFYNGQCSIMDPAIFNASRFLLKAPEHTWGAHNFLNNIDWSNTALAAARKTKSSFKFTELTWHEQRQFIYLAHKALGSHPLNDNVTKAFSELHTEKPDLTGYVPASRENEYKCQDGTVIKFGDDGSLIRLYDSVNMLEWASPENPLGQLTYETFVEADFNRMNGMYDYGSGVGYDKANVTANGKPEKKQWQIGVVEFHMKNNSNCDFLLHLKMLDIDVLSKYGAPQSFYLHYTPSPSRGLDVSVLVMEKTTTRLPESMSFRFSPNVPQNRTWRMSKMGQMLDPCDVVLNGSQYVHAVDTHISLTDETNNRLSIMTLDSPVVLWETTEHPPSPFPVPLEPWDCKTLISASFNLFNNIWNTNYMFWYPFSSDDASFKSRFSIRFD